MLKCLCALYLCLVVWMNVCLPVPLCGMGKQFSLVCVFFVCARLRVGEAEQIKPVSSLIVFTVSSTQSVISTQTAICPNKQLKTTPVLLTFAAITAPIHRWRSLICSLFSPSACLPLSLSVYLHLLSVSLSLRLVCSLFYLRLFICLVSRFPSFSVWFENVWQLYLRKCNLNRIVWFYHVLCGLFKQVFKLRSTTVWFASLKVKITSHFKA